MLNFSYQHIEFKKIEYANELVIKGEITNNSGKPYDTVAVRIILFVKDRMAANIVFTIQGLPMKATKAFKKTIAGLEDGLADKDITSYDISTESAF